MEIRKEKKENAAIEELLVRDADPGRGRITCRRRVCAELVIGVVDELVVVVEVRELRQKHSNWCFYKGQKASWRL